jgi:hypothetical protein
MVAAYRQPDKAAPAGWSTGPAAVLANLVVKPSAASNLDLETIPNAATPVPADAAPLQIPSATARAAAPVLAPAQIPLPPQRSADAGDAASPLDGGTVRLKIADIVGGAAAGQEGALAFADVEPQGFQLKPADAHFVDAGVYADRGRAETLRWVLAQSGDATVEAVDGPTETVWRVKAGPFQVRGDADAAAIMARNAGATDAAVLD